MALTCGNDLRLPLYSCYEFRVQESILFLRQTDDSRELESIGRYTSTLGVLV